MNIVEKVNKNAHDDELQLIAWDECVLYNIIEVSCNGAKSRSARRCC